MKQNSNAFKRKQKKKKQRRLKAKEKIRAVRESKRAEEREKKEIWKIKRSGEKVINRLTATYRKPKREEE